MSDTTQIVIALIASVPATIGACAAWLAAYRTGSKGGLHKRIVNLEKVQRQQGRLLQSHVRNRQVHLKVGN